MDRSQELASGLIKLGAKPQNDQFVGIFSQNRVEWKIVEQSCNGYSMVLVPLYDTLGPESIKHIMNQCKFDELSLCWITWDLLLNIKGVISLSLIYIFRHRLNDVGIG